MQAFNNIGVLATWTGLIFLAWLLVRERARKDEQLSREYVALSLTLLMSWIIGSWIFLWTPTGLDLGFFLVEFNFLLFAPMAIITIDMLLQAVQLKQKSG